MRYTERSALCVSAAGGEVANYGLPPPEEVMGMQATGLISDEPLLKAVRAETHSQDFDEVMLATGRQESTLLARILGQDPVNRLRRRWGRRLIVFSQPASQSTLS
jgi:hypothetical protein